MEAQRPSITPSEGDAPAGLGRITRRALDGVRSVRRPVERWITRSSEVGPGPFIDPARFDWAATLEAGHAEVRSELEAIVAMGVTIRASHEMNAASRGAEDRWQAVLLHYYGMDCGVAQRCPRTMELLSGIPGLRAASFSILWPGGTIAPHRGPYGGVVRYHLGLVVPDPADGCGIRVDDEVAHWAEGRSLLFDESYEHEAWNRTDGMRAVLFLDIVRPLRQPARTVNVLALAAFAASPYARSMKRRNRAWEEEQGLAG